MPTLRRSGALFLALTLANCLPVLWFSHLPSADGPAHVYNASLIPRYFFEATDPARRYVEFNTSFPPNLLAHGLLALFTSLMDPALAERLFVACYVVLLPLALWYAMRAISGDTHGVEFLGLALVFNQHLHWGFYNFLAGLIAYLFALGYWLRHRERSVPGGSVMAMTALVTLIYFCHPVPLLAFWLTMGFLSLVDAARNRDLQASGLTLGALASIPAVCLYVHYALARPAGPLVPVEWSSLRYAASVLARLYPLATYAAGEKLVALSLSALIACGVAWAWTTGAARSAANAYLYAAVMLAGLVFVAPAQAAGGTLITPRLVYFPLFLILIWLATVKWPAPVAAGIVAAAVILAGIGHVSRWPIYQRYDDRMHGFLQLAESRERQPVEAFQIAGISVSVDADQTATPYLSGAAWGYVAAEHRNVVLDYEPRLGYFPFRYRPGADPAAYTLPSPAGCQLSGGGLIDPTRYHEVTGLRIDTQIVWVNADQPESEACTRAYGRPVSAERQNAHGKLLWFDSDE
jgi:hypothetical protein